MEEFMKQLTPVLIEGIKAGKEVGIWYLIVAYIIPILKSLMNWVFVLIICKGVYSLITLGMTNDKPAKINK